MDDKSEAETSSFILIVGDKMVINPFFLYRVTQDMHQVPCKYVVLWNGVSPGDAEFSTTL